MNDIKVGARWWKFDFHNHTPASDDYGKGPNQAEHKKISYEEWLLIYMEQDIDCVAVTDHNSGVWIDPLKRALQELESERHPKYRDLYLFPGVEISVHGGVHILAIFDTGKTTSDIDSLLGAVGYKGERGKSDGCSEKSATEVIDEIEKSGGLAIPAHVDGPSGLFKALKGNTLKQVLNNKNILAIEVTDLKQPKPELYEQSKLNWSEILGSDSHHPSGGDNQRYPGSHFTWVKMTKPSLDGLRLALIDGSPSLKRSDQFTTDPNHHSPLLVEYIEVEEARYLGNSPPFFCGINPWLNTIIGGRGTGKSTLLEFLRIALQRQNEIPGSLKNELAKYSQPSKNRQDENLLRNSTAIHVGFQRDGARFRITWRNDNNEHIIEKEAESGEWSRSEGNIAQRFPVRIYSQKQIFELAKRPQGLLRIVDDDPEVGYRDWNNEQARLTKEYLSWRAQERLNQVGPQEESEIKGQIEDVNRKLEVFERTDHRGILRDYQLRKNQDKSITFWEEAWKNFAEQVRDTSRRLSPPELDKQYFDMQNADDKELFDATEDVRAIFQDAQNKMDSIARQIDDVVARWITKRTRLKIPGRIKQAESAYENLCNRLGSAERDIPSMYSSLVQQKQRLEEKLRGLKERQKNHDRNKQNAENSLREIYGHRDTITELRKKFLKGALDGNKYVQIGVTPFGNLDDLEGELRRLIDRKDGGFERDIGALEEIIRNDKPLKETIEELKSFLLKVYANDAVEVGKAKDRRFVSHIQTLGPEKIDRIKCWFPNDALEISYYLKGGKNELHSIKKGSPGQKTATLLAFILSYGTEPLILDQPEDDLDNQLIYDLIVTQLRDIKQSRQILIVTHNANIVVNGDAENVIALHIREGQTEIVKQGGLQESSIRDEICKVLEGGKEAFDQRYKRINAGK